MSDQSRRIAKRTAGNANLLSVLGDLISSDGVQAMRVPLGTPGQVLTVDLTAECGLAWADAGGGGSLTFSDGVTKTVNNVTNDLVTGTAVAQVDAEVTLPDDNATLQLQANGTAVFKAGQDGTRANMTIVGGNTTLKAEDGTLLLFASGTGVVNMTTPDGGAITINSGSSVDIESNDASDITLTSAGGIVATTQGLIQLNAQASITLTGDDAAVLSSVNSDVTLSAGSGDGSGTVKIQPGTTGIDRKFQIWNGVGFGQQAFIEVSGGGTVDTEMRAAFDAFMNYMVNWGWIAAQT